MDNNKILKMVADFLEDFPDEISISITDNNLTLTGKQKTQKPTKPSVHPKVGKTIDTGTKGCPFFGGGRC